MIGEPWAEQALVIAAARGLKGAVHHVSPLGQACGTAQPAAAEQALQGRSGRSAPRTPAPRARSFGLGPSPPRMPEGAVRARCTAGLTAGQGDHQTPSSSAVLARGPLRRGRPARLHGPASLPAGRPQHRRGRCPGCPAAHACAQRDFRPLYAAQLRKLIVEGASSREPAALPLLGLKIVVDAGNGAGGFFATEVRGPPRRPTRRSGAAGGAWGCCRRAAEEGAARARAPRAWRGSRNRHQGFAAGGAGWAERAGRRGDGCSHLGCQGERGGTRRSGRVCSGIGTCLHHLVRHVCVCACVSSRCWRRWAPTSPGPGTWTLMGASQTTQPTPSTLAPWRRGRRCVGRLAGERRLTRGRRALGR